MNKENAHFLTRENLGQVAVDVQSTNSGSRGPGRETFDYDVTEKGDPVFKASGYTDNHDYEAVPKHGAGDYNKNYEKYSSNLKTSNQVNNFMCNEIAQDKKEKAMKKKKQKIN